MNTIILSDKIEIKNKEYFKNKYQVQTLPKNNTIYWQGEQCFNMYYVIRGRVKIYTTNEVGKEYITHIYNPGSYFGHDTLLSNGIQEDSAITLEECEIVKYSKTEFYDLILNDTEACLKIMQNLSILLKNTEKQLLRMAYNSARKKIADAVLFISKKYCTEDCQNESFHVSRNDLSALSGIAAESVSRTLTEFKKEGLIEAENGQITILNAGKLEALKN
ncbi:MAG: Crp/Fnr family transcriptional regulator [Bacteroidia bacterium]